MSVHQGDQVRHVGDWFMGYQHRRLRMPESKKTRREGVLASRVSAQYAMSRCLFRAASQKLSGGYKTLTVRARTKTYEPKRQVSAFLSQVYPKKRYLARGLQRDLGGLKTEHLPDEARALVAKVPFVEQADARPFASCGPGRVAEKARGACEHIDVGQVGCR